MGNLWLGRRIFSCTGDTMEGGSTTFRWSNLYIVGPPLDPLLVVWVLLRVIAKELSIRRKPQPWEIQRFLLSFTSCHHPVPPTTHLLLRQILKIQAWAYFNLSRSDYFLKILPWKIVMKYIFLSFMYAEYGLVDHYIIKIFFPFMQKNL